MNRKCVQTILFDVKGTLRYQYSRYIEGRVNSENRNKALFRYTYGDKYSKKTCRNS